MRIQPRSRQPIIMERYATLLFRSGLLVLLGSLAPIYCSAGNRPNTVLCGNPSAVWPVRGAARGQVSIVLSGGPVRAVVLCSGVVFKKILWAGLF